MINQRLVEIDRDLSLLEDNRQKLLSERNFIELRERKSKSADFTCLTRELEEAILQALSVRSRYNNLSIRSRNTNPSLKSLDHILTVYFDHRGTVSDVIGISETMELTKLGIYCGVVNPTYIYLNKI